MTSLIRSIIPQILLLFSIATFTLGVWAKDITGIMVSVADGDSITVLSAENKQFKIRMAAIDSPEKAQAFGQRSKQHLSDLVYKKEVRVQAALYITRPDCYLHKERETVVIKQGEKAVLTQVFVV
jgi:endonuclease YncB( thermonuclease family)